MARILVVEDNLLVAKFYRLALERAGGHEVTCTEDVQEVLNLVARHAVDLIILDVSLQNSRYEDRPIDGLELARLVRNSAEGKDLPMLLATAHAMEGDRERLLAASGANAYLEKPVYDPQVLIEKIHSILPG